MLLPFVHNDLVSDVVGGLFAIVVVLILQTVANMRASLLVTDKTLTQGFNFFIP